ncbi:MAG: zinc-dependent alcohol dehydrogenase family protein [Phototrophicaceae bacterium]
MRAVLFEAFEAPLHVQTVPDPTPEKHGVVLKVEATGLCRSDWHGWMGHDADIIPPHVPGHELAGTIVAIGNEVTKWKIGDRVTTPFICACGTCQECVTGNQQVCDNQFQPGFTHWGSFAEYVALPFADTNIVAVPASMTFATAASLGCRFATSFRGVVRQGQVSGGQWVAVHGCGGVGLAAIMIARAIGAQVIAIDINNDALQQASILGAQAMINARQVSDVVEAVREISQGGVHVSLDALGSRETCYNSIANLRKRGKHIQIGLMAGVHSDPPLPMGKVIANELEIYGSHGMQAHDYPAMMAMIESGRLHPEKLITRHISLDDAPQALMQMNDFQHSGVTVIEPFA